MAPEHDMSIRIVGFKGAHVRTRGVDVVVETEGPILRPPETAALNPEGVDDAIAQIVREPAHMTSPKRYGVMGAAFDLADYKSLVDAAAKNHVPIEFHLFPRD
jgi:hypothetical protein